MMANNTNVPEIRFEGFSDAWIQRKLGEVTSKVYEKNKDMKYTETFTNSAEHGVISQREFFDKDISNINNLDGYYVVGLDDFIYNPRISNLAPVGPIKRNSLGRVGVMSPLYYVFKFQEGELSFFEKYFDTEHWHKFMKLNGDSGARADRLNIKDSAFVEMPLPFPSLAEQTAIGNFFRTLDQLITENQRKVENLKQLKTAYLQRMFPQAGERVPRVRFDGFSGDWEIRNADEIFLSVSDKNHSELPVLSASQEYGMILRDEIGIDIKFDKTNTATYKRVLPGQFVIHLRSFQGGLAYASIEGITSPAYTVLDFINKDAHLPEFWVDTLRSGVFIKMLESVTYGIRDGRSISFNDFSMLRLSYPTLAEQRVIGDFFSNIDRQIIVQSEKLDILRQLKTAYLQKMFI